MLPFTFDESAISRIKELDELILTFRVWGVNPRGEICIEVFDSDQREYEPFNSLEFEEHRHENITAYIPKHNGDFIHGVEIIWKDFEKSGRVTFRPVGASRRSYAEELSRGRLSELRVEGRRLSRDALP